MFANKVLRRVKKRVFKSDAVASIFVMIAIAAFIGFITGKKLTENADFKEVIALLSGLAFASLLSWDMIDSFIGEAIDFQVKEKVREVREGYELNTQPSKIQQNQELEFLAMVPQNSRKSSEAYRLPTQWDDLAQCRENIISREAAVRGLDVLTREAILQGLNDDQDPLRKLALVGAMKALKINPKKLNYDKFGNLKNNQALKTLREDIYVYLKAWLMFTIKFGRHMDASKIRQRHPKSETYIKALTHIRKNAIYSDGVANNIRKYIDDKHYVNKAISVLNHYLGDLIEQLEAIEENRIEGH